MTTVVFSSVRSAYLKCPRALLAFGLNLFWVAGYATLCSYITPFLQEATALGGFKKHETHFGDY